MIARAWDTAKACGRLGDGLFRWLVALYVCWAASAWAVGSVRAGRCLDLNEVMAAMGKCLARVGLN
jgi:hypothetical protein